MALTVTHASQPADTPGAITRAEWVENHSVSGTYEAFPVGAIFLSAVSTDPATLLGYGTWSAIGAGRVLIGQDTEDTDFDVLGETGGAKTTASAGTLSGIAVSDHAAHTHAVTSNVAVGDHAAHTHAVTTNVAVGNHTFTQPTVSWPAGVPTATGAAVADHASHTHTYTDVVNHVHTNAAFTDVASATTGAVTTHYQTLAKTTDTSSTASDFVPPNTGNPTGGVASGTTAAPSATLTHSVTQPTIAWPAGVPTNASGAVDAHSVTNNAVTSGNPSATLSHSVTNNAVTSGNPSATLTHTVSNQGTFTGSATSIVQPYLVVKFWQRTA